MEQPPALVSSWMSPHRPRVRHQIGFGFETSLSGTNSIACYRVACISGYILAEISVQSARNLSVFITCKTLFWIYVSKKCRVNMEHRSTGIQQWVHTYRAPIKVWKVANLADLNSEKSYTINMRKECLHWPPGHTPDNFGTFFFFLVELGNNFRLELHVLVAWHRFWPIYVRHACACKPRIG